MKHSKLASMGFAVFAVAPFAGLSNHAGARAAEAPVAAIAKDRPNVMYGDEQAFNWRGFVVIQHKITGRQSTQRHGGIVHAASRAEAMQLAQANLLRVANSIWADSYIIVDSGVTELSAW